MSLSHCILGCPIRLSCCAHAIMCITRNINPPELWDFCDRVSIPEEEMSNLNSLVCAWGPSSAHVNRSTTIDVVKLALLPGDSQLWTNTSLDLSPDPYWGSGNETNTRLIRYTAVGGVSTDLSVIFEWVSTAALSSGWQEDLAALEWITCFFNLDLVSMIAHSSA